MDNKKFSMKSPQWIATRATYFNKDLRYRLDKAAERLLTRTQTTPPSVRNTIGWKKRFSVFWPICFLLT